MLQLTDADWPVSIWLHPSFATAQLQLSDADWPVSMCWHPLLRHICSWLMLTGQWACADIPCCSWLMLTGQWACADIPCCSTSAADWCWLASEHVLTSLATAHLQLTDADWPVSMCWHPLLQHICSHPHSFLHFAIVNAVTAIDFHVYKMVVQLEVCWKEMQNILREPWNVLWKYPLLPQYSAVSSVVFESNYKLVIK
jgi:hypothetical protein